MAEDGGEVGRVCPYARQQCTLAEGCVTHEGVAFGADPLDLEFRALGCEVRGAFLFAGELETGRLRTGDDIVRLRHNARLLRMQKIDRAMRQRRNVAKYEAERDAADAALAPVEGR